jgi:hypothetical protein
MNSPETLAIGKGPAIGAASATAGVTSNAAQATVNGIFRIEVSPFQAGTPGDALGDAQAVLFQIYSSLSERRSKEIFSPARSFSWKQRSIYSGDQSWIGRIKCVPGDYVLKNRSSAGAR